MRCNILPPRLWNVFDGHIDPMVMKPDQIVSAQVLLRAASGKQPAASSRITSENIKEWMPSGETVARVREMFRRLGFEIGEPVGNSLSITGPVNLFESVFKTRLQESKGGGIGFAASDRASDYALATEKIPSSLREDIAAITFTPPPDFGPTNFSGSA